MARVMLTWGEVAFGVETAAYQALRRAATYRIPAQERIANRPGLQFTGPGEETVSISGVMMPGYRGEPATFEALRAQGAAGTAHKLTSGTGEDLGRWALADVTEERSGLFDDGAARKIAFNARFVRDDEEPRGRAAQIEQSSTATGATAPAIDAMRAAVAAGENSADVIDAAAEAR